MTGSWAYIYEHPGADPVADRFVLDRDGQRSTLVPVPEPAAAPRVALDLIEEGVELIELCGGFDMLAAAKVVEAVAGRVPVGWVSFGIESAAGVAGYNARFEAAQAAR